MNSPALYLEIGQSSFQALYGEAGWEFLLERNENGRLTEACAEQLSAGLRNFLRRHAWQPRWRAFCGINARGVSLRRMTLPVATNEELPKLIKLQIEAEFPVSPDDLAWGYRPLNASESARVAVPNRQEVLVLAVKKEVIAQYVEIFSKCGVTAEFTLAAMARNVLCPQIAGAYAILDIGGQSSELILYENGAAVFVRTLPWGAENLGETSVSTSHVGETIQVVTEGPFDLMARAIRNYTTGKRLFVTGRGALVKIVATKLDALLTGVSCEVVEVTYGEGRSVATLGLKRADEMNGLGALVMFRVKETKSRTTLAQPVIRQWAIAAGALLVALALFPYAEAILLKGHIAKKIAEIQSSKGRLATIDRELRFLHDLKTNQAPYLDAIYLIANAAPQGTRIENLSMNGHGEVSLSGNLQNAQQVTQFRSKLIDSGFFSTVVVEEQAPSPDHQKFTVRMSAQWKPPGAREALKIGPTPKEMEEIKLAAKDLLPGGPMGGGFSPPPQMGGPVSMSPSVTPGARRVPRRPSPDGGSPPPPGNGPGPR